MHFENCSRADGSCWCEIRRYLPVLALTILLCAGEVIGGYISHSFALMADAVHVSMDAVAILSSLCIIPLIRRWKQHEMRIRVAGGYVQALLLAMAAAWIAVEAFERLHNLQNIQSATMMLTATAGLFGNYWQHQLLSRAKFTDARDITRKALDRHVLSDLAQSVGVILGGIAIALTGWIWIDPALSIAIACLMACWVVKILYESAHTGSTHPFKHTH